MDYGELYGYEPALSQDQKQEEMLAGIWRANYWGRKGIELIPLDKSLVVLEIPEGANRASRCCSLEQPNHLRKHDVFAKGVATYFPWKSGRPV